MNQSDPFLLTLSLTLEFVQMKVKFPCKMVAENNGQSLTDEVAIEENKFIFGKKIILKEKSYSEFCEIIFQLITNKGAKYVAGVLKIKPSEIANQEGKNYEISLSRCLDNEAKCSITVIEIQKEKIESLKIDISKSEKKHYFGNSSHIKVPKLKDGLLSPQTSRDRELTFSDWDLKSNDDNDSKQREKFKELQFSYRESYDQLKKKYKQQASNLKNCQLRLMEFEKNETNLKMEITKLKKRNEELQTSVRDKNFKLTQLNIELNNLSKKNSDLQYLEIQFKSKQHKIQLLQEKVEYLSKESDELRQTNLSQFQKSNEQIRNMELEIKQLKGNFQMKEYETESQLNLKSRMIDEFKVEIQELENIIQKEKSEKEEMIKEFNQKIKEKKKQYQNEKEKWKKEVSESKQTIFGHENQIQYFEKQVDKLVSQKEKTNNQLKKLELQFKLVKEEHEERRKEILQFKPYRQNYENLLRQHHFLKEEKIQTQKHHEKIMTTKQSDLQEIQKTYRQNLAYHKKHNKDLDEKLKNVKQKIIGFESQLELRKREIEKIKKLNENYIKENKDLKKEKNQQTEIISLKEEQIGQLKKQMLILEKKANVKTYKAEYEALHEQFTALSQNFQWVEKKVGEITKYNENLEKEFTLRQKQLKEEYNKNKQFMEENLKGLEQKVHEKEEAIRQNIEINDQLKNIYEKNSEKAEKLSEEKFQLTQNILSLQRMLKAGENKIHITKEAMQNKEKTIQDLEKLKESNEKDIQQLKRKLEEEKLKYTSLVKTNEKNEKIIEHLRKNLEEGRAEIVQEKRILNQKEKQIQKLKIQQKELKGNLLKEEKRNLAITKEYENFKLQVIMTINNFFEKKQSSSSNVKSGDSDSSLEKNNLKIQQRLKSIIQESQSQQIQIEKLKKQIFSVKFDSEANLINFQKQILGLTEQVTMYESEKEEYLLNSTHLKEQLSEKEMKENQLKQKLDSVNFTLSDYMGQRERQKQIYTKKQSELEQCNIKMKELYEKVQRLNSENRKKIQNLEEQLLLCNSQNLDMKETLVKLQEEKNELFAIIEKGKQNNEDLLEQVQILRGNHETEKDNANKTKIELSKNQNKVQQMKKALENLFADKEETLKRYTLSAQREKELEVELKILKNNKKELTNENREMTQLLRQLKEEIKVINQQVRSLQQQKREQQQKKDKTMQILKNQEMKFQKTQTQFNECEQAQKRLIQSLKKEIKSLQEEIAFERKLKKQDEDSFKEKICQVRNINDSLKKMITVLEKEIIEDKDQIIKQKKINEQQRKKMSTLVQKAQQSKGRISQLEKMINELQLDLKEKNEYMFQHSGKIFLLQNKLEIKENQFQQAVNSIQEEWSKKYNRTIEQDKRLIQIQKSQMISLKEKFNEKEQQLLKKIGQLKGNFIEAQSKIKVMDENFNCLDQEKSRLISQNKRQIQQIIRQNKALSESLMSREAEVRKLSYEMEIQKSNFNKVITERKEIDEKMKKYYELYQNETKKTHMKDINVKSFKETILRIQINIENQIRKHFGFCTKQLISGLERVNSENANRIMVILEENQKSMLSAIKTRIQIEK